MENNVLEETSNLYPNSCNALIYKYIKRHSNDLPHPTQARDHHQSHRLHASYHYKASNTSVASKADGSLHLLYSAIRMHNIHDPFLLLESLPSLVRETFTADLEEYVILSQRISIESKSQRFKDR